MSNNTAANTDLPLDPANEKDLLNITPFADALADYIKNCATPMTIAIQGGWGTGKTSLMNMIEHKLSNEDSKIRSIFLNTWQYSHFNMSEFLPISFLTDLTEKIGTKKRTAAQKRAIRKVLCTLGDLACMAITGNSAGLSLSGNKIKYLELPATFEKIKKQYEKSVDAFLKEKEAERLVVYIDDLDRLNPERAVELLEILKVFLDVKKCVYVLAVDYDVVTKGVRKKFGDDFADSRGKSFFDKMIQLPFHVPPIPAPEKFVRAQLKSIEMGEEAVPVFTEIIKSSIGLNPRAIKRLFNSFGLVKTIMEGKMDSKSNSEQEAKLYLHKTKLLFAALSLQMSFELLYDYLLINKQVEFEGEIFFLLTNKQLKEKLIEEFGEQDKGMSALDNRTLNRMNRFLRQILLGLILGEKVPYGKKNVSKEDREDLAVTLSGSVEPFNEQLSYSSVTKAVGTDETSASGHVDTDTDTDIDQIDFANSRDTIKNYRVTQVSYEEGDEEGKGFSVKTFKAAYLWALEQVCKNQEHKKKFLEIKENPKKYALSKRIFDIREFEIKYKDKPGHQAAIKKIESAGIEIVTHYSSADLAKQLVKFLEACGIPTENVKMFGTKRKTTGEGS